MNKNGLLGLLAISALLDGLNKQKQRSPLDELREFVGDDDIMRGFQDARVNSPFATPLTAPPELAALFLAEHDLRTPSADNIKRMAGIIEELGKIDLSTVDTLYVVALHKGEVNGEPCLGCGEVHDEPKPSVFAGFVGNRTILDALYNVTHSRENLASSGVTTRDLDDPAFSRPSESRFGEDLAREAEDAQSRG